MRSSLANAHGRLRARTRINDPLSYSNAAVGRRSNANLSGSLRESSFFPRKQEFSRKRVLYFSSSEFPTENFDKTRKALGNGRRDEKQNEPKIESTSLLIPASDRLKEDSRNVNLSSIIIPSSIIEHQPRRLCSGNSKGVTLATAIGTYPLIPFAPIANISVAFISTSTSTPTPSETPKPTMASLSKDDSDNDSEGNLAVSLTSADTSGDEKDSKSSENENETAASAQNEENGWKRVRTIKVPQYGPDADKAVRTLQSARKERARVKTSINVQRALYGNMVICAAKLGAWISSGSSSMMSEFVHSVVDCGNQALLLVGLRHTRNVADKRHPYGYGKSVYFWALVSALGTFFMGAGVSMSHSVQMLFHPSLTESINTEIWVVLAMSFLIDGYVLFKTFSELEEGRPKGTPMAKYIAKLRDPATLAVLLEDGAACLGIVIAIAGISASFATSNPIYDGIAGVGISCLLGGVGLALVRVNHSFLIGQAVEKEMLDNIEKIIRDRRSIENVTGIQSQWTGPETFSFKAELDFDGTYLSALLIPRYQAEFKSAGDKLDEDLEVLLSWYAEDVIRAVEREVRHIESVIRQQYPGAEYIELEPMSKYVDRFAIDDSFEEKLLMIEKKELKKWVRVLYENKEENAWRMVDTNGSNSDGVATTTNVVSGSVPTDVMPENGTQASGDKIEK